MPVIINGEVVADSDPRAIAHRNRGRRPQQQRNSSGGIANDNNQSSNNDDMSQISNDMDDEIPF